MGSEAEIIFVEGGGPTDADGSGEALAVDFGSASVDAFRGHELRFDRQIRGCKAQFPAAGLSARDASNQCVGPAEAHRCLIHRTRVKQVPNE